MKDRFALGLLLLVISVHASSSPSPFFFSPSFQNSDASIHFSASCGSFPSSGCSLFSPPSLSEPIFLHFDGSSSWTFYNSSISSSSSSSFAMKSHGKHGTVLLPFIIKSDFSQLVFYSPYYSFTSAKSLSIRFPTLETSLEDIAITPTASIRFIASQDSRKTFLLSEFSFDEEETTLTTQELETRGLETTRVAIADSAFVVVAKEMNRILIVEIDGKFELPVRQLSLHCSLLRFLEIVDFFTVNRSVLILGKAKLYEASVFWMIHFSLDDWTIEWSRSITAPDRFASSAYAASDDQIVIAGSLDGNLVVYSISIDGTNARSMTSVIDGYNFDPHFATIDETQRRVIIGGVSKNGSDVRAFITSIDVNGSTFFRSACHKIKSLNFSSLPTDVDWIKTLQSTSPPPQLEMIETHHFVISAKEAHSIRLNPDQNDDDMFFPSCSIHYHHSEKLIERDLFDGGCVENQWEEIGMWGLFSVCVLLIGSNGIALYYIRKLKKEQVDIIRSSSSRTSLAEAENLHVTTMSIMKNTIIPSEEIDVGERLGKGHFGVVFKGKWFGSDVALKKISNKDRSFIQEIKVLHKLQHPHIVHFLGVVEYEDFAYIVMEFMNQGSLDVLLKKQDMNITNEDLMSMAISACSGMRFLEKKKVIHRDLALRNLLVSSSDSKGKGQTYIVKIGDFGLARVLETEDLGHSLVSAIPLKWSALEVLQTGEYSTKSDVWSFGIVLWELFSMGEVPYPGMNNQQSIAEVRRGYRMPAPERCPEEVKQLMLNCWREDPQERPSFSEIYKELLSAFKTTTPNIEKRALKESRFTGAWAFSEDEAFSFSGSSPIPSNYLQRDPAASGEFPNTPSPQTPTTPRTPKERTPKTPREKTPKTPKEKTPPTPREKILKWSAQMEEEAKKESEEGKLRKMKTEKSFNWEQFA